MLLRTNEPLPRINGRGRRKGDGENIKLLSGMKPGDSLWDIPKAKIYSLRTTCQHHGFRIRVRAIPGTRLYALEKLFLAMKTTKIKGTIRPLYLSRMKP